MNTRLFCCSVVALTTFCAAASEVPEEKTPSGTHEAPDPAIAREGDWYYVFSTGPGIPVRKSKDLVNWKMLPSVFGEPVPAWTKEKITGPGSGRSIWAPDISKFRGRYLLYYCVSTLGSQRSVIGLATASVLDPQSPDAGWKDQGMVLESFPQKDPYNALDPSLCVDKEGSPWLVWGSYWSGIYLAPVEAGTGKLRAGATRHRIAARGPAPSHPGIEGPMIVLKDGYYYLFVSHDAQAEYNVKVGRARSITGPYLDRLGRPLLEGHGTPVIAPYGNYRGTGHNGLLIGQCPWFDIIVHHVLMPRSRDLQVRPLFWSRDGWPLAGEPILKTPPGPPLPIVGEWVHQVGWKDLNRVQVNKGGTLAAENGTKGKWTNEGRYLTMWWALPGGTEAVDECVFAPDCASYVGRNALDLDIRGWRPDKKSP